MHSFGFWDPARGTKIALFKVFGLKFQTECSKRATQGTTLFGSIKWGDLHTTITSADSDNTLPAYHQLPAMFGPTGVRQFSKKSMRA